MIMSFIVKLIKNVTPAKVILWSFTALLSISIFTAYENRNQIYARLTEVPTSNMSGLSFIVGDQTKNLIKEYVTGNDDILGMGVLGADLRQNEARSLYFFSDDNALDNLNENFQQAGINRFPLFTNSEQSNIEVIKIINGEFSCTPFRDTSFSVIFPELNSTINFLCRGSIPAYYGYFSGYIIVFVKGPMNPDIVALLKLSTEKLATEVYFRDVLPTQFKEKPAKAQGESK
jgi:hypothetical protein